MRTEAKLTNFAIWLRANHGEELGMKQVSDVRLNQLAKEWIEWSGTSNTRSKLSLYDIESYHLAEYANSLGYSLASYTSHNAVLVTPGGWGTKDNPAVFSQTPMTRKQIAEWRELCTRVHRFNSFWR